MGWFHDPRICQLSFVGPLNKWDYSSTIHIFKLNLEIWVELYSWYYSQKLLFIPKKDSHKTLFIPKIFVGNIVHSKNICRRYCSSHNYSLKSLFITSLSLKILTLFTLFLLFKLALFIICVGISILLFSKFLTM